MPFKEETLLSIIGLAIVGPAEYTRHGPAAAGEFLRKHPQLRMEVETGMHRLASDLVLPQDRIAAILNLAVPMLVERVAKAAAGLAVEHGQGVQGTGQH